MSVKLTPVLQQYLRLKAQHPDALLFFRLGDFYELFFEDAERAAGLLDLTLTSRNKGEEQPVPMCGVPYHAAQPYIARLLAAGLKVAVCEQLEDPATARGLVARDVVRVITPGTVTEEECLDPRRSNYLVAVFRGAPGYALAAADISTGETAAAMADSDEKLAAELVRLDPAEVLVSASDPALGERLRALGCRVLTAVEAEPSAQVEGETWLRQAFGNAPGAADPALAASFGALLGYLRRTFRASLAHLRAPAVGEWEKRLVLDEAAQRNLELLASNRGERRGSLLGVLDATATPMGSRLLRAWMLAPLVDPRAIAERLDAVEELVHKGSWRRSLRAEVERIGDAERLAGRLGSGRVSPRDLLALRAALERAGRLQALLAEASAVLLRRCRGELHPLPEVQELIARAIVDDPPATAQGGGVIRNGYSPVVDELRELARSGKAAISQLEAAERQRTGIQSLKVRYNQVFGYSIEVTKANLHLVPPDYRRKQTLAGAERFVTPALEEFERRIVGAEQRLNALEAQLFGEVVAQVARQQPAVAATARALAAVDVLVALAEGAERRGFVRPRLRAEPGIWIRDGRHPVVEAALPAGAFVPNDCRLDPERRQIVILTGPNMAGKSTYLRQVALIALMAQMGSFVPAAEAEIGVIDRLFTRVGAADNLAGGESTFMVEMRETAHILENLTPRSLVILDEIGRGTSTFDGISIAWAVAEHLHDDRRRPLVLFATHYHELTDLARTKPRAANASVAVREWKGEVIFLRRVVPEPASRSYGIEVVERAREILRNLEGGEFDEAGSPRLARRKGSAPPQLSLFSGSAERLRHALATLDIERMTPLEALLRLSELVREARQST